MKQELSYVAARRVVEAAWCASDEGADEGGHEIAMADLRKIAQDLSADELRNALLECVEMVAEAINNGQKKLASRAEGWFV